MVPKRGGRSANFIINRLISTAPNVVYRVVLEDGAEQVVTNPADWPK